MSPAHAAEALTIAQLLGGERLFGIPHYQRPYAWRKHEADQLLTDLLAEQQAIKETGDNERACYLGLTVIIDNTPPRRAMTGFRRSAKSPSEVVDGKQRLTTITMLIAILRDRLGPDGARLETYLTETGKSRHWPKGTPRLLLESHEQDFLTKHVLPVGATRHRLPKEVVPESIRRMREVRDFLCRELERLPVDHLGNLARTLLERCEVTVIMPKDIASGYRTFVAINFRGKHLSTTDIVKAELFGTMEPAERRKVNERWMALQGRLEPHPDDHEQAKSAASFDNLLSHVHRLRCRYGTPVFQGIAELAAASGNPKTFIADVLEPLGDTMLAVKRAHHQGSAVSADINRVLTTLNWLPANDWVPAAMSALHINDRRPQLALKQLTLLQRLAYSLAILSRGGHMREQRYRLVLQAIGEDRDLADPAHPFALSEDEDDSMARLLMTSLYRARGSHCRPVLAWIAAAGGKSQLPGRLDGFTVEHILPQTPTETAYWRKHFPDPRIREAATRSLGNLALVTQKQNGRGKNLAYPEKIAIYFDSGYTSPFDTTAMLKVIHDWTPEAVLSRETMMYERVASVWGLKIVRNRSKLWTLLRS